MGAGRESIPALQRARQLGYHLIATDGNSQALGFACVDEAIFVSTYAVKETVAYAVEYAQRMGPIHGVIALAADVPQTVAAVAAALGLPGISAETAHLTSDKFAMKLRFLEAGVPIPWFAAAENTSDLMAALELFPYIVVKPVDNCGSRGVTRINRANDLSWAFEHARGYSSSGRVLIEEWIPGPQYSSESIFIDGEAVTPSLCDRNYEHLDRYAPFVVENGGQWPPSCTPEQHKTLCTLAENAGRALGISTGTMKGDLVWAKDGPVVIEMAARLSGGYFSSIQCPLATGVDFIGIAMRLACGESVSLEEARPKYYKGCAIRYWFLSPGKVEYVHIKSKDCAEHTFLYVAEGDILMPITNHTQRPGCVITTGETREDAVQRAEVALATVEIEVSTISG